MPSESDRAWALLQAGKGREALDLASSILAVAPSDVAALVCQAMARWSVEGDNAGSLAEMARAVEAAPRVPQIRYNYGNLLGEAGRVDDAATQYREALRLSPDNAQAFWKLARVARFEAGDPLIAIAVEQAARPGRDPTSRELYCFALAKAFDDVAQPDRAMEFASAGNGLSDRSWNATAADASLERLRELAADDAFRRARSSGHPTRAPVFIVGMPRSGTTLIETILSRHPKVLPLGESKQILQSRREALPPRSGVSAEVRADFSRDWLRARAEVLARAWSSERASEFKVVTDKMPDNAYELGLVSLLFPHARVIYARRHPLDTGISNFFVRYEEGQGFSYRLDWIGRRSRQLSETMAIWKRALDLPILDVTYERLVTDPEPEIRRIADFAGLDWVDDLLTPERANRLARTASEWQVRQPIHRGSIARWKRYEPWLGPMIDAMGGMAWVEREAAQNPAA